MGEPFHHELRVRYHECDAQGILFNAHYLAYFDICLTELWRAALGGYAAMTDRGVDVVVAEAQVRFRAPARFDEILTLQIAVSEMGRSSIRSRHTISRADTLIAEGAMRHVCVSTPAMERCEIPGWLRDALGPWSVPEPAAAERGAQSSAGA